ncbi:short-chain dehydrogenase/reductase-like protein SDR [Aspergillus terreus]|uniref:Short-chain dehydrogenase/reductase-like protein SDR n=1 Tax=Aspergillus terreus TaxID=33178 RepID=A0A5M3Z501_ASPTE|nr:hypothetical protein ATETN484_0007042600 [Aspergillus terreus]GFF16231.1 short-chain dehydrogenase/reductase-like protein SDR [Aspergillus terreus]
MPDLELPCVRLQSDHCNLAEVLRITCIHHHHMESCESPSGRGSWTCSSLASTNALATVATIAAEFVDILSALVPPGLDDPSTLSSLDLLLILSCHWTGERTGRSNHGDYDRLDAEYSTPFLVSSLQSTVKMNPVNTKPYYLPSDATWFVTGCSSGIGREVAALIASKPGQRLVATARNPTSLSYLPDSDNILKLALDVNSPASVDAAFAAAAAHFGSHWSLDPRRGRE